jgi:hypoxanthine phosphoribosyltransferase
LKFTGKEISLGWGDIDEMIESICIKIKAKLGNVLEGYEIIAIAKGGIIPATIISYSLGIKNINLFPIVDKKIIHDKIPRFDTAKKYLLIDEIYDTGETFSKTAACLEHINHLNVFLIQRYSAANPNAADHIVGKTLEDSRWVVFPWEIKPKCMV